MNKTHLVVKGTPKFDGTGGATIPNLKGTDSNSNLKKPNQSEVQNLIFFVASAFRPVWPGRCIRSSKFEGQSRVATSYN